jgi:NAD(P)-dependent dehydrogenase (short-subunit alcohol dehydrogenase family)
MSDKKVWLVTGAGRGLGVDIAKAALAAGHAVVATGRRAEKVTAAVDRFGRIDVLLNNAGNFNDGFFEELSPGVPGPDRDHLLRPGQRHPRGTPGDARATFRPCGHDLLNRRP